MPFDTTSPVHVRTGMIWVPGGTFTMGSHHHYPEEAPARSVTVDGFWMDKAPTTNAQFEKFVNETGYVTLCERVPDPVQYPGVLPEMLQPASVVFQKTSGPVSTRDHYQWWKYIPGANWRNPEGPNSSIKGKENHPVVHVAYEDVQAYAKWINRKLPTEAEWEFAARGGLENSEFAWGEELNPDGRYMANTWQGNFPWENLAKDGFDGLAPVDSFPANGYGLLDMIGNAWEWTADWYSTQDPNQKIHSCCQMKNPRGGKEEESRDPRDTAHISRKVMKGGSYLCAPNYCRRYRPSARMAQPVDTSTCHLSFRLIVRGARSS